MENGVLFQGFEWYLPDDGQYYKWMIEQVSTFKKLGVTALWIPPACKGTGSSDVGYGIYDLYDLGEFDQKGTVRTKYGTKMELIDLIQTFHKEGIQVYADVVMNHKAGADRTELFQAIKTDPENRNNALGEPKDIEAWTGFDFPGRMGRYSEFKWNFTHFNGVDYDQLTGEKAIFRIVGENKGWNDGVSSERGNYDYLMFADIDHAHPAVKEEFKHWAEWFVNETKVDGFRLDAVKHIDVTFMKEFKEYMRQKFGDSFFLLGEYWTADSALKERYLNDTQYDIQLFDVGLHYNFFEASQQGDQYDLRRLFGNTIIENHPEKAVTFVDNHDSQPGQALQSWVEPWFKAIAYAFILLGDKGYPCVFFGDYFETGGDNPYGGMKDQLDALLALRQQYCYGEQTDYYIHENLMGWVRQGNEEHPLKAAIVISNKNAESIRMHMGEEQKGKVYRDFLGQINEDVYIDDEGYGEFKVNGGSVSVWVVV